MSNAAPPWRSYFRFGWEIGWIAAVAALGVVAARLGLAPGAALAGVALAGAPALVSIAAAGRRQAWARTVAEFAWLGFATAACGATGGFASPLAAAFAVAPAYALRFNDRAAAAETGFFALTGFAVAGLAAHGAPELAPMLAAGFAPGLGAAACLALTVFLLVGAPGAAQALPALSAPALPAPAATAADAQSEYRRRAAELSHELRTPLTHILGFADIMRQRVFGPMHERYGDYVELIHTSGRNLLDLVNGLLDLSRLEAGRYALAPEPFDLRILLEEAARLFEEEAARKGVVLGLEAPAALPVTADPRAFRQILSNLIANALKFTPENGAVLVRAGAQGGLMTLDVEDTGPGIPAADRARLGEAFERGAGVAAEGYGLGLALVRALAALHGGRLMLLDAPAGGALVRVEAPVLRA